MGQVVVSACHGAGPLYDVDMLMRIATVIHAGLDHPRLASEHRRLQAAQWETGHEIIRLREALAAAVDELRGAHEAVADAAALRHRIAYAPTADTHVVGCWTLGGHDAALAAAAGESDLGVTLLAPPTVTLRDLGVRDALFIHEAKGCGRAAMSRAALTLRLAGVVADSSWSRWLR